MSYPNYCLYETQEAGQTELNRINQIDNWAELEIFPNCIVNGTTYICGFQTPYIYILNQLNPALSCDLETEFNPEWRGEQPPE